jgi:REP element-mobilizing transposase RayT
MLRGGYRIRDQKQLHFLTFTVVEWVDVFTRVQYTEILLESLQYCQKEKELLIHCYCLMTNHIHLILSVKNKNLSGVIRDFKTFTAKQIVTAIVNNQRESRKNWMLPVFKQKGEANLRNKNYQFWKQHNRPMELHSPSFTVQKLNYIHFNPVRAGIVENPEDYIYSSAWNYKQQKQRGRLEISFV